MLGVDEHTCRGYMKSVRHKPADGSQLEALIKAQQLGLIEVLEHTPLTTAARLAGVSQQRRAGLEPLRDVR